MDDRDRDTTSPATDGYQKSKQEGTGDAHFPLLGPDSAGKNRGGNLVLAGSAGTAAAAVTSAYGIQHIPHHVVVWGSICLIVLAGNRVCDPTYPRAPSRFGIGRV